MHRTVLLLVQLPTFGAHLHRLHTQNICWVLQYTLSTVGEIIHPFLSGVIERWELIEARSKSDQQASPLEPQQLTSDLNNITSWLENVISELDYHQQSDPAASIADMEIRAKELKV